MLYLPNVEDYPKLTPEEKAMPVSKFYYTPLTPLNPVYERAFCAPALSPEEITDPNDWWKLVRADGYNNNDFGYGMMENGAGYLAVYTVTHLPQEQKDWFFNWMGIHPKGMPEGQGNIRYKIWCPPDHFEADHSRSLGRESLDLGQGDPKEDIFSYPLDPVEMGLPQKLLDDMAAKGVSVRIGYEKFDHPGTHITFGYQRTLPDGGVEEIRREWIGYMPQDGKFVRDSETPCDEQYLRKIVIHNCVEHFRLETMLPSLYAQYHDQPIDAD